MYNRNLIDLFKKIYGENSEYYLFRFMPQYNHVEYNFNHDIKDIVRFISDNSLHINKDEFIDFLSAEVIFLSGVVDNLEFELDNPEIYK